MADDISGHVATSTCPRRHGKSKVLLDGLDHRKTSRRVPGVARRMRARRAGKDRGQRAPGEDDHAPKGRPKDRPIARYRATSGRCSERGAAVKAGTGGEVEFLRELFLVVVHLGPVRVFAKAAGYAHVFCGRLSF